MTGIVASVQSLTGLFHRMQYIAIVIHGSRRMNSKLGSTVND